MMVNRRRAGTAWCFQGRGMDVCCQRGQGKGYMYKEANVA